MYTSKSLKRKSTMSTGTESALLKKSKATHTQNTHLETPEAESMAQPAEALKVIRRSCTNTSVSHHSLLEFRSKLDEAAQEHARTLADQPENPILPGSNQPRFTFSTYQMKLPTELLIEEFKAEPEHLANLVKGTRFWRQICLRGRLNNDLSFRKWEWSAYEPEKVVTDHSVNESAVFVKGRKQKGKPDLDVGDTHLRYFERVQKFTYNRKEDPVFRGERWKLSKRNSLVRIRGDYSDDVEDEDFGSEYSFDSDEEDTSAIDDSGEEEKEATAATDADGYGIEKSAADERYRSMVIADSVADFLFEGVDQAIAPENVS